MRRLLIAFVPVLLMSGCASLKSRANGWAERRSEAEDRKNFEDCVQSVEYTHYKTMAGHDGMAEAYFTDKPTRPYEEIGQLAFTASSSSPTDSMIAVLRTRAAREGADAIMNIEILNAATGSEGNAYAFGNAGIANQRTQFVRVVKAKAIRFTDMAAK